MATNVYMVFEGDGYQTTIDYCRIAVRNAAQEMLKDGSIDAQLVDIMPGIGPFVRFKIYFNERTIKSFIQLNVEVNHTYSFKKDNLKERIIKKIKDQFKYDTLIYPEIVNVNDKDFNSVACYNLSPYAIGYWVGLTGNYEFIQDRSQLNMDSARFRIPSGYDEHGVPIPPSHKMDDWFADVVNIGVAHKVLNNYALTEEGRDDYITIYEDLMTRTHGEGEEYEEVIEELKDTYNPNEYTNANIPDAFEDFKNLYNTYFGYTLDDVCSKAREYYVKILLPQN